MKIIKLQIEDLLPKKKKDSKNKTRHTEQSYNESMQKIHKLEKKLEIATKALKKYSDRTNWDIRGISFMKYSKGYPLARKALKEMEGVK